MSKKYLITLTPMGTFYFGGEHSFSIGKDDQNELASYIVKSNKFPQQTSLLGMLRFLILKNAGDTIFKNNKIQSTEKAQELIGKNSFCVDKDIPPQSTQSTQGNGNDNKFGKIKNIGFCFLMNNDNIILPTPLDYKLKVDFNESIHGVYNDVYKTIPTIRYTDKKNEDGTPKLFSQKEGLVRKYISVNGEVEIGKEKAKKTVFEENDIFQKDQRIGINRDITTGLTEENALYKQIFYRLKDGFKFAFTADLEITPEELEKYKGQIVELGGDSSKFVLEIKEQEVKVSYTNELLESDTPKIVLLSDSLIENSALVHSIFSISEHLPFRFLSFNTNPDTKYARTSKNDKPNRFSLFKRGTVFYFENENKKTEFEETIKTKQNFREIGYNKY